MFVQVSSGTAHLMLAFRDYSIGRSMTLVISDKDFYFRKTFPYDLVSAEKLQEWKQDFYQDIPQEYKDLIESRMAYRLYRSHNPQLPDSYVFQIPGLQVEVKHPVHGWRSTLETIIISLNDSEGWTREQIADWLETLDENPVIEPPKECRYV